MTTARLYNRKYTLRVGEANVDQGIVVIENHHIDFKVELSIESKSNSISCDIYNLSDNIIAKIDKKDAVIFLDAGYEEHFGQIFGGRIASCITQKQGPNLITTINAADGLLTYREGRVNYAGGKGTTLRQALTSLIKGGFPAGTIINLKGDILDKQYNAGISFIGSATHNLDVLCQSHNLMWHYINERVVNVFPKGGVVLGGENAVLISPKSGLIDSIEKVVKDVKHLKRDKKAPKVEGLKFKSLLNHEIVVGRYIKLEGSSLRGNGAESVGTADGQYRVTMVHHNGSYEGSTWTTTVECTAI